MWPLSQRRSCPLLLPTRELATQAQQHLRRVDSRLTSVLIIGGASMYRQIQELRRHPRLLIATPGRLVDLMRQKHASLKDVSILVLDEADRMLDMGFAPQINAILRESFPPVSLPKREFMEKARVIWDELGLPTLTPKSPWYGYSLGDWDEELDEEARLAVEGDYLLSGEKLKRRRVKV